jgi:phenylacetate-CoA ligase
MTPSLRGYLERNYRIPVQQAYGLNEIGAVAVRCDAGRYHVNIEHCLVEIVTEDGRACAPGETGHLLVTGFRNPAMPLIRYDTGDLAEVVAGPCACGRTLPSFGEIAGRHRSYAGLPNGSRERVKAIRAAIEKYPTDQAAFLRRYQIHQGRENTFTLKLQTVAPIPEAFRRFILAVWEPVAGTPPLPLTIVECDDIAIPSHGKMLDFVSEFHSDPWPASPPQPAAEN